MIRREWVAVWVVACVLTPGSTRALAQGVIGGVVGGVNLGMGPNGQPYTVTQTTTTVQRLYDGTTITRTTTTKRARDSQGRTYQQNEMKPVGALQTIINFNVFDPVARVQMSWNSQNKQVTVFHMPEPKPPVARPVQPAATAGNTGSGVGAVTGGVMAGVAAPPQILRTLPDTSGRPKVQTERLDGKTIAGVYAEGRRTTTTYPVGYFGNDRPLVTTQEIWTSRELGMVLMTINDDPRTGVGTMETTDLNQSEPDPALFQPPEGYTVRDQNPQVQ